MPIYVGQINARIEVRAPAAPPVKTDPASMSEEHRHARAIAEQRFDCERRIDQRDPDLLGGR